MDQIGTKCPKNLKICLRSGLGQFSDNFWTFSDICSAFCHDSVSQWTVQRYARCKTCAFLIRDDGSWGPVYGNFAHKEL